jgi:MtrB/PioB family decaheme-associated outer membrane protein
LANVRYEDRDDKTPVRLYSSSAVPTSTFNGFYEPRSITRTDSKFEAGYRLPNGFHLTGGAEYNVTERFVPYWFSGALASVATREKTDETILRLKLRRSLSETVNGSISYAHSDRDGTNFVTTVVNSGTIGSNLVSPVHLSDRERDQWRLAVDWTPTEPLSLQFAVDASKDEYSLSGRPYGPTSGKARLYSVDASYALSDKWRATAWVSQSETRANQVTQTSAAVAWAGDLRDRSDGIGIGVRGNPTRKLELSADLQRTHDRGEYRFSVIPSGNTPPPDTHYRISRARLHGKYAVNKDTTVGLNYVFEYWNIDDWTWTTWTYTDGTRVTQEPRQTAHFIGAYVQLRWW